MSAGSTGWVGHETKGLGAWRNAEIRFEQAPASLECSSGGPAVPRSKVSTDQEPMRRLAIWVDVDRFHRVPAGQARVALSDPDLAEALQRSEPDVDQLPTDPFQPFRFFSGQNRPRGDRPRGERPTTGGGRAAVSSRCFRVMDGRAGGVDVEP